MARRSTVWALAVVLMIVPIVTPVGAFFLAEPALVIAAGLTVVRRRYQLQVPLLAFGAMGMLALLGVFAIEGHHGGLGYVQALARTSVVLLSFVTLIYNRRVSSDFLLDILMKAVPLLVAMLVVERVVGITWDPTKLFATIDRSYRVSGPLGPGATASVLLAAGYVAVARRRHIIAAVALVGMLLLASRAHLVAAAVILVCLLLAGRLRARQLLALTIVGVAAASLVPSGVERLLTATQGAEQSRARLGLWNEILRVTTWGDTWIGLGPGSFSYRVDALAVAHQAHSQFLSPWLDLGLMGIIGLTAVVAFLWRRSGDTGTRAFLFGWLALCVFGEFMFAPTMPLMLGALPSWLVVMVGTGPDARRRFHETSGMQLRPSAAEVTVVRGRTQPGHHLAAR